MTTPRTNATAQACFWPSGCSDKRRCFDFNGCVADAQNKAARLAREKPLDAAAAAGRLAGDPRAEIGVLRQIKTDLETELAAQQRKVEALRKTLGKALLQLRLQPALPLYEEFHRELAKQNKEVMDEIVIALRLVDDTARRTLEENNP